MADGECIFCKIVKGELPCAKVYEDGEVLGILDIYPINKGHSLIFTKQHFKDIYDVPDAMLSSLALVTKAVSLATKKALACDGINIVQNNERPAGQLIFHIHYHVIPRFSHDGMRFDTDRKKYEGNEMGEYSKKIRGAL